MCAEQLWSNWSQLKQSWPHFSFFLFCSWDSFSTPNLSQLMMYSRGQANSTKFISRDRLDKIARNPGCELRFVKGAEKWIFQSFPMGFWSLPKIFAKISTHMAIFGIQNCFLRRFWITIVTCQENQVMRSFCISQERTFPPASMTLVSLVGSLVCLYKC